MVSLSKPSFLAGYRTNSRIAFEESNFVTCLVCEDYDLCIPCHVGLKHGHHPSHPFAPVSEEQTLDALAHQLLVPGRNMRHMATCDGCDKVCPKDSTLLIRVLTALRISTVFVISA